MDEKILKVLSEFSLESTLVDEIVSVGRAKRIEKGEIVVSPDMPGNEMPIVVEGLLKVMRQDKGGNEIFLYYLEGGETCAMSITCCLEGRKTAFKVLAEEDSLMWMIPISKIDTWVSAHQSFRKFIFGSYQTRFDELLATIDSVVFSNMDDRLYKYLLDTQEATGSYKISKTHQQVAHELNTSRVVVSRLLKQLEREGKIEQHRNRIDVL